MKRSLPLALATVFSASFLAWAQLGGAGGMDVPFAGFLQDGAAAMNDSDVEFTFTLFDSSTNGVSCDTYTATGVAVVDGRFSTVIEDVAEACVKRKDPHVEIAVDGVALTGRQRLYPAVGAYTSGGGDLDVPGAATIGGAATITGNASIGGTLAVTGTTTASTINASGSVKGATGVTGNTAFIGDVGHGPTYAGFAHETQKSTGSYALLQSNNGTTYLNAANGFQILFRTNNTDRMIMSPNGTLSTYTGTTPGSAEALKIVRGTVLGNGTITNGTGFTVTRLGVGVYSLGFSPAFGGVPSVVCAADHPVDGANASGSGQCMPNHPNQWTVNGGRIYVAAGDGANADFPWSFIAMGPR